MSDVKVEKQFKGIFVPYIDIQKYGGKKAIYLNAYLNNAPGLSYRQKKIARDILNITLSANEIKNFIAINKGNKICEWCNSKTFILHKHHYPISKKNGGDKTVNICPNCHSNYHFVENGGVYANK